MRNVQWCISPGALLMLALAYFFDNSGLLSAIVPAVVVHELGHCLMLWLAGMRIRRFTLGLFGLEIDYLGAIHGLAGACAVLAGPLAGLIYALALSGAESEFWRISAAASFLLSGFNLLPVLPLDGGRLLLLAAGGRAERVSLLASLALAVLCISLCLPRGYFSLFILSLWLVMYNLKPSP